MYTSQLSSTSRRFGCQWLGSTFVIDADVWDGPGPGIAQPHGAPGRMQLTWATGKGSVLRTAQVSPYNAGK